MLRSYCLIAVKVWHLKANDGPRLPSTCSQLSSISSVYWKPANDESCCTVACFRLARLSRCFWALCRSGFSLRQVFTRPQLAFACFLLYHFFCSLYFSRFSFFHLFTHSLNFWALLGIRLVEGHLNGFRSTTIFYTLWLQYGSKECLRSLFVCSSKQTAKLRWKVHLSIYGTKQAAFWISKGLIKHRRIEREWD